MVLEGQTAHDTALCRDTGTQSTKQEGLPLQKRRLSIARKLLFTATLTPCLAPGHCVSQLVKFQLLHCCSFQANSSSN